MAREQAVEKKEAELAAREAALSAKETPAPAEPEAEAAKEEPAVEAEKAAEPEAVVCLLPTSSHVSPSLSIKSENQFKISSNQN